MENEPQVEVEFIPRELNGAADLLSKPNLGIKTVTSIGECSVEDEVWEEHIRGHFGPFKVWKMMELRGKKVSLKRCREICGRCRVCAFFRRVLPRGPLGTPPYAGVPGHTLYSDVIGPVLPGSGGRQYIIVVVDSCTRVAMAKAVKKITSARVLEVLKDWKASRGPFKVLVLDNASYNKGRLLVSELEEDGVEVIYPPPYRHEAMGLVERFNFTLEDRIRRLKFATGGSWTRWVQPAIEVYNTTWHDIIEAVPEELWKAGPEQWKKAMDNWEVKRLRDHPKIISPGNLKPGGLALVYDAVRATARADKFAPFWRGPVRLVEKVSNSVWRYKELETSLGPGRKRINLAHESHLQTWEDKV